MAQIAQPALALVRCPVCGGTVKDYRLKHHMKVWHPKKVSNERGEFFGSTSRRWPKGTEVIVDANPKE